MNAGMICLPTSPTGNVITTGHVQGASNLTHSSIIFHKTHFRLKCSFPGYFTIFPQTDAEVIFPH